MRVSTAVWLALGLVLAAPAAVHATTVGTPVAHKAKNPALNAEVDPPAFTTSHGRLPPTAVIVPSPVIDTSASFFVGTGDGGQGSWVRP